MALDTYSSLKNAALAWVDHQGVPGAVNIIDDCVTLCEARINKHPTLRLSTMETEATLTLVDGSAALPADFLAMKRVLANYQPATPGGFSAGFDAGFEAGTEARTRTYEAPQLLTGAPQAGGSRLLSYAEPGWYEQAYPFNGSDEFSTFYTIIGTTIRAKGSSDLNIIYYAKVPPLATNDPNWLLSKAPDVYLYGTILELLTALEGDAAGKYAGLYGQAVEALIGSETFSRGGVLTMRASMPAP